MRTIRCKKGFDSGCFQTSWLSLDRAYKNDFMNPLLVKMLESSTSYIWGRVNRKGTIKEKLNFESFKLIYH